MSRFLITIKPLDGDDKSAVTAIGTTVDQDLRPGHPIVLPEPPNRPGHPIYLPPHPSHPIVIQPPLGDHINNDLPSRPIYIPGYPTNPIVLPPIIWPGPGGPNFPTPPIVIPPEDSRPGFPMLPIVLPPEIWDPAFPGLPIVIPPPPPLYPEGGCPPRPNQDLPSAGGGDHIDNTLPGGGAHVDNTLPPHAEPKR
jgi:hypothetical protein